MNTHLQKFLLGILSTFIAAVPALSDKAMPVAASKPPAMTAPLIAAEPAPAPPATAPLIAPSLPVKTPLIAAEAPDVPLRKGPVLVLGFFNGGEFPFINLMLTAGGLSSPGNFAFPSVLNSNGYPVTTSLQQNISGELAIPGRYTDSSTHWVLEWTGTQGTRAFPGFQLILSTGVTEVGSSGCVSGTTRYDLTVFGTNCKIEFTFNGPHAKTIGFRFLSGASFDGSLGNLAFYRKSQESAFKAGEIFNPDFVSAVRFLNPRVIRTVNWNKVNGPSNIANAAQQIPTAAFSYGPRWDPTIWVGAASGTNAYAATLKGVSTLVDGQTVQVQFTNANTSINPTFNLNSSGAFPIVDLYTTALGAGKIPANSLWTLTYDAALKQWLGYNGGINIGVPLSTQIALANKLNADLWSNIPPHATDAFVATIAATQRDTLNGTAWYEFSNEIWNFAYGFPQTYWAVSRGAALGLPLANAEQLHGFYALRVRQVMDGVTTVYGSRKNYKRVLAIQAYGDAPTTQKFRMQGFDLNGAAYPLYCAAVGGRFSGGVCTGDPRYNIFPNRPIDYTDILSYAPYYSGAQLTNGNYANALTTGGPSGYAVGLLGAADDYATGIATNISKALAWVDWDLRKGTRNGIAGNATLEAFNSGIDLRAGTKGIYSSWEAVVTGYDSARPTGASKLSVVNYEAGMEAITLTTAQCATLGISMSYGGAGGKVDNLLTAYKNSALFQQLVTDQFNQFLAQPHSLYPAWYEMAGEAQWSLYSGDIYSTAFTSYNAVGAYRFPSAPTLLK